MLNRKVIIIFIPIILFGLIVWILSNFTYKSKVSIDSSEFIVEVAETKYFLEKGLSGHPPLKSNEGMFFIFQKPDKYGFWMKDMTFPIDIIWIDRDFRIVHIEKDVKPETYPKAFYPSTNSMYVLEISGGQSSVKNFKIGDFVKFERKAEKDL